MKRLITASAAALLLAGAITSATLAQDATPVPAASLTLYVVGGPIQAPPAACTTTGVTQEQMVAIAGTPVAVVETPLTGDDIIAIDATAVASAETVAGVLDTVTQFIACNNAGNRAAVVALFTPAGQQRWLGTGPDVEDAAIRNGLIAAGLTPSDPRGDDELAGVDGVLNIVTLADGRIAALVLNTDPRVAEGDQVIDLFIIVEQDGKFLIDEFIGDPFDQTPGYGYDKAE